MGSKRHHEWQSDPRTRHIDTVGERVGWLAWTAEKKKLIDGGKSEKRRAS